MIFVIDPDNKYKQVARLDFYIKSVIWKEYMLNEKGGEFTIVLKGGDAKDFIANDMMITNSNGFKIGLITSISYKMEAAKISEITVSGKMAETILERRIVKGQMQLTGTIKQIITDIINRNVIKTSVSDSNIPMKLNFIGKFSEDEQTYIAEDGNKISACMNSLCMTNNLLYYFTIENEELVLNFKEQEDKSYILFGSDKSNIYDISTKETIEEKANAIVVKGDIVNQSVPYVYVADKAAKGLHWIETFVDKSSEIDSENVAEETYVKGMKQIGKENLATYQIRRAFDSATYRSKYNYPDEIFLGDVVTVDVDGMKEPQRIVSYFYSLTSQNKEEISFTLSQVPVVITDIDSYVVLGDVPKDQLDEVVSDATSNGANKASGGGIEIIGRILCKDYPKLDGTIQKLKDGLYRVNIYTWNENQNIIKTDESGNQTETLEKIPYSGEIYFQCPFDILSYVKNDTQTIDIDNFDNSHTRIDISSAYKGVLYRDQYDEDKEIMFENPTEYNAGGQVAYRYNIESENLNFNISFLVSIDPVAETIPLKPYSKSVRIPVRSYMGKGINTNDCVYDFDGFLPDNFVADAGDWIKLRCTYAPIKHTNDPNNPYVIDGPYELKEFIWTFKKGEKVKDKVIRLEEGAYDFINYNENDHWWSSSFKKLEFLKSTQTSHGYSHFYGGVMFGTKYSWYTYPQLISMNSHFLVKQDPAFDTLPGVDSVKWTWFEQYGNDTTKPNLNLPHDPFSVFICTSIYNAAYTLEELCNDLDHWEELKAEWEAN